MWTLDDSKGYLNVKMKEMCMRQISNIDKFNMENKSNIGLKPVVPMYY